MGVKLFREESFQGVEVSDGRARAVVTNRRTIPAGFTVEEMINLDLSYAPPYSSVWDPVHIAIRRAAAVLIGRS